MRAEEGGTRLCPLCTWDGAEAAVFHHGGTSYLARPMLPTSCPSASSSGWVLQFALNLSLSPAGGKASVRSQGWWPWFVPLQVPGLLPFPSAQHQLIGMSWYHALVHQPATTSIISCSAGSL